MQGRLGRECLGGGAICPTCAAPAALALPETDVLHMWLLHTLQIVEELDAHVSHQKVRGFIVQMPLTVQLAQGPCPVPPTPAPTPSTDNKP